MLDQNVLILVWLPLTSAVAINLIRRNASFVRTFCMLMLTTYVCALVAVTLFPIPFQAELLDLRRSEQVIFNNYYPFRTISDVLAHGNTRVLLLQLGGNLFLLIPLTLLLPIHLIYCIVNVPPCATNLLQQLRGGIGMLGKYKGYGTLILTVLLLSLPLQAEATVPVSSGYISPGEVVFIAMHYEDVSPVGPLQVKLEQDLIAIEHVFKTLQREGKLDQDFPRLVIVAAKYYELENRFETAPAVLSLTNSATLVCNHPESSQFEPKELGSAYVISISTGLLNYRDLMALMLLAGGLNDQYPRITINSEEELAVGVKHPDFESLLNFEVKNEEYGPAIGGYIIASLWRAEEMLYSLMDKDGNKVLDLLPAGIYKGRPSWAPALRPEFHGRILAYASEEQVKIHDLAKGHYHALSLDFTFADTAIHEIWRDGVQRVRFAMHATENKIYVLPFAAREFYISVVYSLDLDTGEWARELASELGDLTLLSEVWTNIENRVWTEFVSAVPDGKILNIDILTEELTENQNFPHKKNVAWPWLILLTQLSQLKLASKPLM
ncbi:MAG: hypothetical protein KGZ44_05990 [Dethiobacter sp.]|nr:hypothetical protein [Dethiobacter sp.]